MASFPPVWRGILKWNGVCPSVVYPSRETLAVRVLIIALVCLIVLVAGGTAALIAVRIGQTTAAQQTTPYSAPPKPGKPTASQPTTGPTAKPTEKAPPPTEPSPFGTPMPTFPDTAAVPEVLPPRPGVSAKSKFKAFDNQDLLLMETAEDGSKRVMFVAEVCLRGNVMLEVFCCKKNTKEHEAIVSVDLDARLIHAALLAAGAESGKPVQFVNPRTQEAEYKPASGQRIGVTVCYRKGDAVHTTRAQDWIIDQETKKPIAYEWVFAGSRFVKVPDRPTAPPIYTANSGEVISISNFLDSMLDVPVEVSQSNTDLHFRAARDKIPPLGSKVWVILTPLPDPEKK